MFWCKGFSVAVLFFSLLQASHAQRTQIRREAILTCDGDIGKSAFVPWALDLFNSVCGEEACQPQFVEAKDALECELSMPLDHGWIVRFSATDTNQNYSSCWTAMDQIFGSCFNSTTDVKPSAFTTTGIWGTPTKESYSVTIMRDQKLLAFYPFDVPPADAIDDPNRPVAGGEQYGEPQT